MEGYLPMELGALAVLPNKLFTGHQISLLSILAFNISSRPVYESGLGLYMCFETVGTSQNILQFLNIF